MENKVFHSCNMKSKLHIGFIASIAGTKKSDRQPNYKTQI